MKSYVSAFFIGIILLIVLDIVPSSMWALSKYNEGYKSIPSNSIRVDLRAIHGDCKKISSTGAYQSFISTYTSQGWGSFKTNHQPYISLQNCVNGEHVTDIGRNWEALDGDGETSTFVAIDMKTDTSGNVYVLTEFQDSVSGNYIYKVRKYTSTGAWIFTIGSGATIGDNNLSGNQALFYHPRSIMVDQYQNIYVVDAQNYNVKKYSSTGAWLYTIGSTRGDAEFSGATNQFYRPTSVYDIGSGAIAVLDLFSWGLQGSLSMVKVKIFNTGGSFISSFGTAKGYEGNNLGGTSASFLSPTTVLVDRSGGIYVHDLTYNRLISYSSTGNWISNISPGVNYSDVSFGSVIQESFGTVKMDASRNKFILDCGGYCLKIYSSTGAFISQIGYATPTPATPVDNNLSGTGARFTKMYGAEYFAVGSGSVFILSATPCYIKQYNLAGTWQRNIGEGCSVYVYTETGSYLTDGIAPAAIEADTSNNLYLVSNDYYTFKIKKYSSTGALLMQIGGDTGDNDLSGTSALISNGIPYGSHNFLKLDSSGNIYVLAGRLKKYSSTGAWLTTIGDGTNGGNNLSGRSAGISYAMQGEGHFQVDNSGGIYIHNGFYNFRKYSSTGVYLLAVGDTSGGGGGDNNLSNTSARISKSYISAIDSTNNVYLADYGNQKIKKYSSTGAWMMTIGSNSLNPNYGNGLSGTSAIILGTRQSRNYTNDGDEQYPRTVANYGRNLYFLNLMQDQVIGYNASGTLITTIGQAKGSPSVTENNLSGTSALIANLYMHNLIGTDTLGNIWIASSGDWTYSYYNDPSQVKKYTSSGVYVLTVGSTSIGDNNLSGTNALFRTVSTLAFGTGGTISVMDNSYYKFKSYTSTGQWLSTIGSGLGYLDNQDGTGAGFSPSGFSVKNLYSDNAGNAYVISMNQTTALKKYKISTGQWLLNIGAYAGTVTNNLSGTYALLPAISTYLEQDINGNIWLDTTTQYYNFVSMTNYTSPKIQKYSSTGAYLMTLGSGVSGDNTLSGTGASFTSIQKLQSDSQGNIFVFDAIVNDYSVIKAKKYSSGGVWQSEFSFDQSCWTNTTKEIINDFIYVYDCVAASILKYDINGNLIGPVTNYSSVQDAAGNQYELTSYTVNKYDSGGNLIMTLGQGVDGDNNLSGTSALFNASYGMVRVDDSQNIYVTIYNPAQGTLNKIKKYSATGAYMMTLGSGSGGDNNLSGTAAMWQTIANLYMGKNDTILLQEYDKKLKFYSTRTGDWISTIGDGTQGDNELSGTGAAFSLYFSSVYQSKSKDNILLYDWSHRKIKIYSP